MSPTDKPVYRFAPSPNGALHLGHARSAILNRMAADQAEGRLLLRMEDIDVARCRPELEAAIIEDLHWLGIAFDGAVRRQSEHFDAYREALEALRGMGLIYPSFVTRAQMKALVAEAAAKGRQWPLDPDGAPHPPPQDKQRSESERAGLIAEGRPFAWRLDMEAAIDRAGFSAASWAERPHLLASAETMTFDCRAWGDVVLARKDTPTSYHLSVVIDDALQGITDIVRGRDLFAATAVHRLLQNVLGLPEPVYHHHSLVLGEDGRKLSKSVGSASMASKRDAGMSATEVWRAALETAEPVAGISLPETSG